MKDAAGPLLGVKAEPEAGATRRGDTLRTMSAIADVAELLSLLEQRRSDRVHDHLAVS